MYQISSKNVPKGIRTVGLIQICIGYGSISPYLRKHEHGGVLQMLSSVIVGFHF
jgi:hypothetical protein